MKKIVNHPKDLRLEGIAESEGVGYLPIREFGPMSIQTTGFFASINEDESINCNPFNDTGDEDDVQIKKGDMANKIKEQSKRVMKVALVAILACIALLIVTVSSPYYQILCNIWISIAYLMLIAMVLPKATAVFLGRITKKKEVVNFSKYLAAKNAVQNAYYDLGKAPSLEEAKGYSLHSADCPYTKNGYLAFLVLVITIVRFLSGVWYWLIAILAIGVMCLMESKNLLTGWQWLVVSKPDEEHYKVAIRAMEETAEIIDSIQISYHEIKTTPDPENFNEEECKGCPAYDFCKDTSEKIKKEEQDDKNDEETVDGDSNPATETAVDGDAKAES